MTLHLLSTDFKDHRSQDTLERHYQINIQINNDYIKKIFIVEDVYFMQKLLRFCSRVFLWTNCHIKLLSHNK